MLFFFHYALNLDPAEGTLQKGSKGSVCIHAKALSLPIRRYDFLRDHFWVNFGRFAQNGHKPLLPLILPPRLRAPLDQG